MPEYLENPRRVPRVPVRCRTRVFLASGAIETTTEDIGSRGCQVVLPAPAQRGDVVGLALSAPGYSMTLRVDGRVAWVSAEPPWHVGIAYAAMALPGAARWMEGLRQAMPDVFAGRRPHERLAVDAMIFLGTVPSLPEFREDEVLVLRTVGAGVRVGELRTALSRTWPRMQRALFTLLARGHITLSRADAAHPVAWKHVLGEPLRAGSDLAGAAASNGGGPAAEGAPAAAPVRTPTPVPGRITAKIPIAAGPQSRRVSEGVDPHDTPVATPKPPPLGAPARSQAAPAVPHPPAPVRTPTQPPARMAPPAPVRPTAPAPRAARSVPPPPAPAAERADATRHDGPPAPDFVGAGVGWRSPARPRSPEADTLFKLGMAELDAHRPHGALALLRRALSLSPGDPEIATAIGRAMRGDGPLP